MKIFYFLICFAITGFNVFFHHLPKGAYLARFSTHGEALPLQRMFLKK